MSVSIKGMDDTASYSEFRKEDLRNDLMAESRFRHMELPGRENLRHWNGSGVCQNTQRENRRPLLMLRLPII